MLEKTEMQMLRRIRGVTLREYIRNQLGVAKIIEKVREARLRWFGHVKRMDDSNPTKEVMNFRVDGRRSRGRPKKRWSHSVTKDMTELRLRWTEPDGEREFGRPTLPSGKRHRRRKSMVCCLFPC